MNFFLETFTENGKKYVNISAEGASGATYEYKTIKELAEVVQFYLEVYYRKEV